MKRLPLVATLAFTLACPDPAWTGSDTADRSIAALRIMWDGSEVRGTAVLVRREERDRGARLYFLTSSRLFHTLDGDRIPRARAVYFIVDGERTLPVRPEDVFVQEGLLGDVAVIRVITATTGLRPLPLVYEPLSVGTGFLIAGYDQQGAPVTVHERIRYRSTRYALGDWDASGLLGCVGAPAISEGGVFGVVSGCRADECPEISLLSLARPFIERHLSSGSSPSSTPP